MLSGIGSEGLGGSGGKGLRDGMSFEAESFDSPSRQATDPFDVDRARRETPGCAEVAHFNNAGSSLPPQPVLDAVIGHLELEASIGGYEAADAAQELRTNNYSAVSKLLNCSTEGSRIVLLRALRDGGEGGLEG